MLTCAQISVPGLTGAVAAGQHCFPVALTLPQRAPGSFLYAREGVHARVEYSMAARVVVKGVLSSNLEARSTFTVVDRIQGLPSAPAAVRDDRQLSTGLCCFARNGPASTELHVPKASAARACGCGM